jgi:hypothetical protein
MLIDSESYLRAIREFGITTTCAIGMVWFDLQWYHVRKLDPLSNIVSQQLMDGLAVLQVWGCR